MADHDISSVDPADVDERKRELRAGARARRAAADPAERADAAPAWTAHVLSCVEVGPGSVVAAYTSYGAEPPTAHLIDALLARDVEVLLPVLLEDRDLDWESAGTLQGREAISRADAVVVPALLVGLDGARLGQGGGSYDRALPRLRPGTSVLALVHDDELVDAGRIPHEDHDRPVTHVVRPSGVTVVTTAPGSLD